MKIDIYSHILPERYFRKLLDKAPTELNLEKRVKTIPCLKDLSKRFQIMDSFEAYFQVLVLGSPPIEMVAGPNETPELARIANDEIAELVTKSPDRFLAGVACLPMNNKDAAAGELDRAIKELNLKGVQIFTQVNGKPLDDQDFSFVFKKMAEYDLPIFLHPARGVHFPDYTSEKKSRYEIWFCFGWPYETSAAMTRIIFSGVFDKYPNLKIITHHLGGMIPYFNERIRSSYDQFGTRTDEDGSRLLAQLKKHPYEYFRMFYADTAVNGSIPAMECGLAFFSANRIVFGTDMPYDIEKGYRHIRKTIESIEAMTASNEDRKKIYETNARKLLKL